MKDEEFELIDMTTSLGFIDEITEKFYAMLSKSVVEGNLTLISGTLMRTFYTVGINEFILFRNNKMLLNKLDNIENLKEGEKEE